MKCYRLQLPLICLLTSVLLIEKVTAQSIDNCETARSHASPETALIQCLASEEALESKGHLQSLRQVYINIGAIYQGLKNFQKAVDYYNKALIIDLKYNFYGQQGEDYRNLGDLYYILGKYEQAIRQFQGLLRIARWFKNPSMGAEADHKMGLSYEAFGNPKRAVDLQKKAIILATRAEDDQLLTRSYLGLSSAYITLKKYEEAIHYLSEVLQQETPAGDKTVEIKIYSKLGIAYYNLNNYEKSIEYQDKALAIALETHDLESQSEVYNNLGLSYYSRNDYLQSLGYQNKALEVSSETKDEKSKSDAYGNLGLIYFALGEYAKANEYQQLSLGISQSIHYTRGEAAAYSNLGIIQDALEDYRQAIIYYEQAQKKQQNLQDKYGLGVLYSNIATAYKSLNSFQKAEENYTKALSIFEETEDKMSQAQVYGNLGNLYEKRQQFDLALTFQQRAIALYSAIGLVEDIYYPQWGIARVLAAQNQQSAAILFYKRAINTIQVTRDKIKSLDPKLRKSYVESKVAVYRQLVDLLLKQGRVLEAQKVLDLLKEQEVNELLRSASGTGGTTSLNEKEEKIWQNYQKTILGKELKIYQQRDLIDDQIKLIPVAERTQSNTYKELSQKRAALEEKVALAVKGFDLFLKQAAASLKTTDSAKSMEDLQTEIDRYNKLLTDRKAAVISTLVLPDRLELILLTPDTEPLQRTVKVAKAELDALILKTRTGISNPGGKSLPDLQELYQYLIAPLEPEIQQLLKDKKIDTLVFAPDQNLRLIPLEALHDGKQYLIERLPVGIINSLSTLSADNLKQPQMIAMGLSKAQPNFPGFDALPGVVSEVNSIGKLYNGQVFLNEQFTKSTIQEGLGTKQPLIMHMATHANFGETKEKIFVLLFGEKLSLEDIKSLDLRRISLLTLSACETATSSNSGVGLASIAGGKGAQSVLGSLWEVSDNSTSLLMQRLYANLKAGMPKAEALRQAQLTMIQGQTNASSEPDNRGGVVPLPNGKAASTTKSALSDPFYWAPFILIGNWR